jgi:quinolinate synthase
MERARAEHPGATIMVHPECVPEVVAAADLAGSTSAIIRFAENIPDGSTLYIGTEINLVQRLADRHAGRVTILPLVESACTHMAQTTEESLAKALDSLSEFMKDGTPSPFRVHVSDAVRAPAGEALKRMLSICR